MKESKNINSKFGSLYSVTSENNFVWAINVKRCSHLLHKEEIDEEGIADALISLHIILEVSLNAFFRDLVPYNPGTIENLKIMENLDKVSIINKTRMFLYTSDFNFKSEDLEEKKKYGEIIKHLIKFSEIRNLLVHGSTVMRVENSNKELLVESRASKIISQKTLKNQVNIFKYIIDGMRFYINHLDLERSKDRHLFRVGFLNYEFLPGKYK